MSADLEQYLKDAEVSVSQLTVASLPSTREGALRTGSRHYFTGKPCKRGHVSSRHVSGDCLSCDREKKQSYRDAMTPEEREAYNAKQRAPNLARVKQALADPEKRKAIRAREQELHNSSPTRKANKARADAKRWARMNAAERQAVYQQRTPRLLAYLKTEAGRLQHQKGLDRLRAWRRNNPARELARARRYQLSKRQAAPKWLTEAMQADILRVYEAAERMRRSTGEKYEVDHIIPLNSPTVCGLHVPWNLQVLTEEANRKKGNKIPTCFDFRAAA